MTFKKGTRVRASQPIRGKYGFIPRGTPGEIVAEHPKGITVKWDPPGLLMNAFDSVSAKRLLDEEVDFDD